MLKDRVIKYLESHNISETDIKLADALFTLSGLDKIEHIENLPLYGSIPLTELRKKINYEISCGEILNHIKKMSHIPYPNNINASFDLYALRSLNKKYLLIVYTDSIDKLFGITPEKEKFNQIIRKIIGELAILEEEFPQKTKKLKNFLLEIELAVNTNRYDDILINSWLHYIENNFILRASAYIQKYGKELASYLKTKIIYDTHIKSNLKNLMKKHHIKNLSELNMKLKKSGLPISNTSLNKIFHNDHLEKNKLEIFIKLKIFFNCTFDELFQ